jgi:hypothetical protein
MFQSRRSLFTAVGLLAVGISSATAQKMYWVDTETGLIERAALDGTQREVLVQADHPVGIALDLRDGAMYWTQQDGTIWQANLDGSQPAALPLPAIFYDPTDLEIDPGGRMLYVALRAGAIYRVSLDSNLIELVYAFNAILPLGIALDPADDKLLFTTEYHSIWVGNLDGSGAPYAIPTLWPLYGVADIETDVHANRMYYTELIASRITSSNYYGGQPFVHFVANAIFPGGLALDRRPNAYWGLYFTDPYNGDILRAPISNVTPAFERVVDDLQQPGGIALQLSNAPTPQVRALPVNKR